MVFLLFYYDYCLIILLQLHYVFYLCYSRKFSFLFLHYDDNLFQVLFLLLF
nr:MAG TPA_asm: hypothetical protein [Bacteriophage sp.]